jgi:hypothetical protein
MFLSSCANKPCKIEERKEIAMTGNEKTSSQIKDLSKRVFVYKNDGSVQCENGGKIPLDVMKKDLGSIEVFSSSNKHDGMMRIQVCGAPTGYCNVYEIDEKDLDSALKAGFKKWVNN